MDKGKYELCKCIEDIYHESSSLLQKIKYCTEMKKYVSLIEGKNEEFRIRYEQLLNFLHKWNAPFLSVGQVFNICEKSIIRKDSEVTLIYSLCVTFERYELNIDANYYRSILKELNQSLFVLEELLSKYNDLFLLKINIVKESMAFLESTKYEVDKRLKDYFKYIDDPVKDYLDMNSNDI